MYLYRFDYSTKTEKKQKVNWKIIFNIVIRSTLDF